jgi:hypothetical protein
MAWTNTSDIIIGFLPGFFSAGRLLGLCAVKLARNKELSA